MYKNIFVCKITNALNLGGWGRGHGNRSKSFYGGTATEEDWDTNLLFSPAGTDHMANFQR